MRTGNTHFNTGLAAMGRSAAPTSGATPTGAAAAGGGYGCGSGTTSAAAPHPQHHQPRLGHTDTLFQLECVLLFALDVVKGPYIHSCAPASPPDAIRSFLLAPAATPVAPSSTAASAAGGLYASISAVAAVMGTPAASTAIGAARRAGQLPTPPLPPQQPPPAAPAATVAPAAVVHAASRSTLEAQSGGEVASAATPLLSSVWFPDSPATSASAALRVAHAHSSSSPSFAVANGSFDAPGFPSGSLPSPSFPTPPPPPPPPPAPASSLPHSATGAASGTESVPPVPVPATPAVSSALAVSAATTEPSPPLRAASTSAGSSAAGSPLPAPVAHSGGGGGGGGGDRSSVASSLAAQLRLLDHADALDTPSETRPGSASGLNSVAAATAAGAAMERVVFGVSALTCLSDSQQGASPLFGSFAAAAPGSTSGDGLPVEVSASGSSTQGCGGSNVVGDTEAVLTEPFRGASASPVLTPVNTPPIGAVPPHAAAAAAAAARTGRDDARDLSDRAARGPQHAVPHSRQQALSSSLSTVRPPSCSAVHSVPPPLQGATAAAASATTPSQPPPLPPPHAPRSSPSADDGRMSGYNDVFVPRPEFCRRVLWLYPAESGLLFLYYPEDIPGEHYQRKTLRYSLCLVFRVDQKRMTIGDGLLHQLVRPYSVVLTNIAEELREAELKYAYMSRGLRSFTSAATAAAGARAVPVLTLTSSVSSSALVGTARRESAAGPVGSEDGFVAGDEDEDGAPQAGEAAAQSTAPKPYTLVRRRAGGAPTVVETSSCSPSRPHAYHLNLVEHGGVNAGAGGGLRVPIPASVMSTAEITPTSFMSPLQPTTPGRRQGLHDAAAVAVTVPASPSEASRVVGEGGDALAARSRAAKDDDGVRAAPPPAGAPPTASQGAGQTPAPAGAATAAATAAVPTAPSGSTLHTTSNTTAASTVAHTPVSHFGTPFSPPPVTRSRSESRSGTAVLPELPQSSTSGTSGSSGGGGAGGAAGPAAFASPSLSTDAETADTGTTPPSSLPLRSRTASHGEGLGFHAPSASSAFLPTMGESTSTLASSSAPASALTPMTGPPNTTNSSIVVTQPPPHAAATSSNSPRSSAAAHRSPVPMAAAMVSGAGGVVSGMHTLNAFITPPTAPQWTPLGELVEALFHCLRYTGDVADAAERDGERETYNVGGSGGGGLAGFGAAGQRTPATATPTSLVTGSTDAGAWHWPDRPHGPVALGAGRPAIARTTPPSFAGSPQQPQHVSIQSIYSPLTTAVGSSFGGDAAGASTYGTRTPSWMTDNDANLGLFDGGKSRDGYGGAGPTFPSGAAPVQLLPPAPPQPPQQRGDTGLVHLSNRLSFHVRRMAPLQPARLLHFDHVPVPVVAYDPAMMGWMDMAVHHVFRLVDGVRTVADLVFDVAMGTTTTLSEVYAEALQRTLVVERLPGGGPAMAPAPNTAVRGGCGGSGGGGSATGLVGTSRDAQLRRGGAAAAASESVPALNGSEAAAGPGGPGLARGPPTTTAAYPSYPVVVSVPIDARPSPALLPGVRYSVPTSAAAAAAAAAISEGQAPPPSHVNVRVAPCTSPPAPPMSGASAAAAVPVPPQPPQPHISVELPPTWVATTGMVMEALLHLELCHLIKVYRPWTKSTVYSTTRAVQRVLRSAQHPARRVVAHYILCIAWTERQEARAERRRRASEWKRSQREARRQAALNAAAPGAAGAPPVRSATQKAELSQTSPPSCAPSPSPQAPASTEVRTPHHAAARPYYNGDTSRAGAITAFASLGGLGGAASACAVERPTSHATAPLPASPQPRSLTRTVGLLSPSLSRPPHPPMGALPPGLCGAGDRGGAAGAASYGLELSSTGTHASSSAATSFAPSSLRHALSVGASGRLQMTLTSSLPTSPLLRAGANPTAAAAVPPNAAGPGSSQRLFVGSQSSQLGVGDLLPCASTGIKYTSRSPASKHPHAPPDTLRQLQTAEKPRKGRRSHRQRCSEERCSSTSTSSSNSSSGSGSDTGSSASSGRRSTSRASASSSDASTASAKSSRRRHRIRSSSSGPSVASSPSASSSDESLMPSSPASAATAQQLPQRRESVPAAQEVGGTSAAGAIKRGAAAANGGDSNAMMSHAACALQQGDARVRQLTASSSPALPNAATATAAAAGGPQHGTATHRRQSSPKMLAPSETDIAQAAAALLCALAKFSNSSVSSVQAEMRRIPVWASSFNHWSDRCVDALVEVAVLNNWLEDVSQ